MLYTERGIKCPHQVGLELSSLIGRNDFWNPETCETVHVGKQVLDVVENRQWVNKVEVDMPESAAWVHERREWRCNVFVYQARQNVS